MNLGLGFAECFKNLDRRLFRAEAYRGPMNDRLYLGQFAAMLMAAVGVALDGIAGMGMVVRVTSVCRMLMDWVMIFCVIVTVIVRMSMRGAASVRLFLFEENFSGQIFFPIDVHIHFHGGYSTSQHPHGFQMRTNIQSRDGLFEEFWRYAGIDQRAQEHVATNARETVEISYSHK